MKLPTLLRRGRPRDEPDRRTDVYPRLQQLFQVREGARPAYKPTPKNLRYFGRTPHARRAINTIKNSIAQLGWEIVAKPGAELSDELERQIEVCYTCFEKPNEDDSFSTFIELVIEDLMHGAGAYEQQVGGDPSRPLWMWPVDGLSIQIYPWWDGKEEARYCQTLGYGQSTVGAFPAVQLRNDELVYVKPNPTTADPFGFGPLEVAFMTIGRLLGVADYAGLVSSNANPSVALWLGNIDADSVSTMRTYWKNEIEGQGRTPLFGGGDKEPKSLELRPEGDNALYLKYQEILKAEIATSFDISPQNLGLERDINRNTAEVAEDRDIAQAIGPWGRKVASQMTRESIQGRLGFSQLEFRFKGLDRDDEKISAEVFQIEYQNNATTPNEYRARKGHPLSKVPYADMLHCEVEAEKAEQAAEAEAAMAEYEGGVADEQIARKKENKESGSPAKRTAPGRTRSAEPGRTARKILTKER